MTYGTYTCLFSLMMWFFGSLVIYIYKSRQPIISWFSRCVFWIRSWKIWYWRFFVDIRNYRNVCKMWREDHGRLQELEYLFQAEQAQKGNLEPLFRGNIPEFMYETYNNQRYRWGLKDWQDYKAGKILVFEELREVHNSRRKPGGYYIKRNNKLYEVLRYRWLEQDDEQLASYQNKNQVALTYLEWPVVRVSSRSHNGHGRSGRRAKNRASR